MAHVHVIGAGLAGLSTALALTRVGRSVTIYESGPQAGGRCRSYFDRELGCRIDNGNHLLLSGNTAAFAYLDRIGASHTMGGPGEPFFPFMDVRTGERWTLRPGKGRLPWWIFSPSRRVPGTTPREYLSLLRLKRSEPTATVAVALHRGPLYTKLIEPLAIAALNTPPEEGSARLLARVVAETLMRGGGACVPAFPRVGLSESLIDPALAYLRNKGAAILFGHRITALRNAEGCATSLETANGSVAVDPGAHVILAAPPWIASALLPNLTVPTEFEAILNIHFRVDADPDRAGFIGLVSGTAEWVFVKPGHVSVTISAANRLVDQPAENLAAAVWPNVCSALRLSGPMPPWRVVKEKRATFRATPAQDRLRPPCRTSLRNVLLAGDWTATGLPGTIEGAIRSGQTAAEAILAA
ncbi:MAG: FAD-dependent oxidoreductase [Acetobacteraceae bacterium]|nr:FAD-dependent oxidoreductase [Acetobacteraceae bacterium]MBV8575332.1 FAD-dependent oxidoreductase [Acetobacteraceae bacterium]